MRLSFFLFFSFLTISVFAKDADGVKNEIAVFRADAIKSCLVDLYIAQQKYFETNDTYTKSSVDLKLHQLKACRGIQISFDEANAETFTLIGQIENEQWSLDESKSLTQIR